MDFVGSVPGKCARISDRLLSVYMNFHSNRAERCERLFERVCVLRYAFKHVDNTRLLVYLCLGRKESVQLLRQDRIRMGVRAP